MATPGRRRNSARAEAARWSRGRTALPRRPAPRARHPLAGWPAEAWRLGPLCPLSRVEGKGRALGTAGHHPSFLLLTGKAGEILGRARSPHGYISGAEAMLLGFRSRPCPSAATSRKPGALSTSARVRLYTRGLTIFVLAAGGAGRIPRHRESPGPRSWGHGGAA